MSEHSQRDILRDSSRNHAVVVVVVVDVVARQSLKPMATTPCHSGFSWPSVADTWPGLLPPVLLSPPPPQSLQLASVLLPGGRQRVGRRRRVEYRSTAGRRHRRYGNETFAAAYDVLPRRRETVRRCPQEQGVGRRRVESGTRSAREILRRSHGEEGRGNDKEAGGSVRMQWERRRRRSPWKDVVLRINVRRQRGLPSRHE